MAQGGKGSRLLHCKDGKAWETFGGGSAGSKSRLQVTAKGQLLVSVTSIPGGPIRVLVDDLSVTGFRHKLVQDVFVQWTWKREAFGLRCNNAEDARNFNKALTRAADGMREVERPASSRSFSTSSSYQDEGESDDQRPLRKVENFNVGLKRSNSVKKNVDLSILASVLESMREEQKRHQQTVLTRLDKIETLLKGQLSNSTTPTQSMTNLSQQSSPRPPTLTNGPPPPPPPSASTAAGGPPPPPPPPAPTSSAKTLTLAEQLQAAKLNQAKSGGEVAKEPSKPKLDFSSELQNRIKKRSEIVNNKDEE